MPQKLSRFLTKQVSCSGFFACVLACSSLLTVTGYFGQLGWLLDATSHFRVQYAAVQFACCLLLLFKRKWKILIAGCLFLMINAAEILSLYVRLPGQKPEITQTIKILQINVHASNTQYSKTIQYVHKIKPDILSLQEISARWLTSLSPGLRDFQFSKIITREDSFGMALFSRLPLHRAEVRYFGSAGVPSIVAQISIAGHPVSMILTHPVPPDGDGFPLRNEQLESISAYRTKLGKSVIVIGDLNITSLSYYFKRFAKAMNVYDSRKGFGVQPTWPAMLPVLLIPIDHILVSKNVAVLERKTGPDIGSDHYPVYIEVGLE